MSDVEQLSLIDSHCHLNFKDFDEDRSDVVQRALKNRVDRIIIPGTDLETSRSSIEVAHSYPGIYTAIGVHPNSGESWTDDTISELKQLASEQKVVAIGEIGLDYYRDFCPREKQREIFTAQLELAAELGLPVIVHMRESSEDSAEMLVSWYGRLDKHTRLADHPGVLHSYAGNLKLASELVAHHFKLGISGPITYKNSQTLRDVVCSLPLEAFLIETDAPYLTPHPYRGKRNEPTNVRIVAEKIAEVKGVTVEQVGLTTTCEADTLFRLGGCH